MVVDVVVIGGGAAGLSGAVVLARSRRSVLVIDAGQPRNAPAAGVHNFLGREGTPPGELLAAGRAELAHYGGRLRSGTAVAARRVDGLFPVELADGEVVTGRRLLVTSGLTDELPDVPGLRELWGSDVLHCPYCHGWEVRDQPIGVLASGPLATHQALLFGQLSADVTLFTHTAAPDDDQRAQLAAVGVRVVEGTVVGLATASDTGDAGAPRLRGVRLADGRTVPCTALVVGPRLVARSAVLDSLGLAAVEHPVGAYYPSQPGGATELPGVYLAGNVTDLQAQVIGAAGQGVMAGATINAELVAERVQSCRNARV